METDRGTPGSPWYTKFFEYLRNRNRIGPGKVELTNCDFFIVGPRRTLRVLRPALKSGKFYENSERERPESVNGNFFSRWSKRPHSSENCRCSFRQSSRLSTTEEEIISTEINRIRTSLCEAEKTGENIEEIEKRVSLNLENLRIVASEEPKGRDVRIVEENKIKDESIVELEKVKNKIVRDLERYINDLLEEIMSDTIKFISEAGNSVEKKCRSFESMTDKSMEIRAGECLFSEISYLEPGTFKINFAFPGERSESSVFNSLPNGYVNRAFEGTAHDPDALNFYLHQQLGPEIILEQLDYVDSGINSVETVELQQEYEPSLEESLLEIIDAKLGRTPLSKSCENLEETEKMSKNDKKGTSKEESKIIAEMKNELELKEIKDANNDVENLQTKKTEGLEKSSNNLNTVDSISEDFREIKDIVDDESFERLRLEFKESTSALKTKARTVSALREKLMTGLNISKKKREKELKKTESLKLKESQNRSMELEDYRKKWPEIEVPLPTTYQDPNDFIIFRRNRKPTIVFLHGFGSSAEIFEHQMEYFSNLGYPCIAPDMLGHGMSSAPNRSRDYSFEKLLKDLELILHHYAFKPGHKCVLVAHNYGCSFATALASKYNSNIYQLVLISGGGPTPLAPPSSESAGHCCLRAMLAPFLVCGLHRDILYSATGRQHPYCGLEPEEQWPSHMKYVLNGMVWPEGDYVFHRRICTPTLLIHGLRDNKVSLVQECQMERTMLKAFLEAMPAAGHLPMSDCPDLTNHMIHCFIDLWKSKKCQ